MLIPKPIDQRQCFFFLKPAFPQQPGRISRFAFLQLGAQASCGCIIGDNNAFSPGAGFDQSLFFQQVKCFLYGFVVYADPCIIDTS